MAERLGAYRGLSAVGSATPAPSAFSSAAPAPYAVGSTAPAPYAVGSTAPAPYRPGSYDRPDSTGDYGQSSSRLKKIVIPARSSREAAREETEMGASSASQTLQALIAANSAHLAERGHRVGTSDQWSNATLPREGNGSGSDRSSEKRLSSYKAASQVLTDSAEDSPIATEPNADDLNQLLQQLASSLK